MLSKTICTMFIISAISITVLSTPLNPKTRKESVSKYNRNCFFSPLGCLNIKGALVDRMGRRIHGTRPHQRRRHQQAKTQKTVTRVSQSVTGVTLYSKRRNGRRTLQTL